MADNLNLLTKCYIANCNKEFKKRKDIRDKQLINSNKLHDDYKNNIISKKEFISKLIKLDNKYYNSIETISLYKCEIDKCYNLVKNHLNYLSDRNNYKKKDNYTINDYLKIVKLYQQQQVKKI